MSGTSFLGFDFVEEVAIWQDGASTQYPIKWHLYAEFPHQDLALEGMIDLLFMPCRARSRVEQAV